MPKRRKCRDCGRVTGTDDSYCEGCLAIPYFYEARRGGRDPACPISAARVPELAERAARGEPTRDGVGFDPPDLS